MTHTTTDAAEARALDRAEAFAKSPNATPEEHDDIMVAVRLARLAAAEAPSGAVATAATTTEDQLRRIQFLADVELHLKSCRIFLTSREKMHPCGIELHDELLANVTAAIEQEGRNG